MNAQILPHFLQTDKLKHFLSLKASLNIFPRSPLRWLLRSFQRGITIVISTKSS